MSITFDQYTNTLSVVDSAANADMNLTTKGTGSVNLNTGGGTQFSVVNTTGATNYFATTGSNGGTPALYSAGASTNIGANFVSKGTGSLAFYTNGSVAQLVASHTASAVNYVQVTGGAIGGAVQISSQGSDSSVDLAYLTKSDGYHRFWCGSVGNEQFRIIRTLSAVNYFQATGGATGFGAVLSAQGSDANIPAVVQPKGTGALQAQQTDSTATGGNARGANAVDWQTTRNAASQVASGAGSFIGGGTRNASTGGQSVVVGGYTNSASGGNQPTVVSGAFNSANSTNYPVVVGGISNNATNDYTFIGGGSTNTAAGFFNFIGAGQTNSGTSGSAVTTQGSTITSGSTAVTLSGSNSAIKVGQLISGTGITGSGSVFNYVAAISGTSLTLATAAAANGTPTLSFYTPHGVVVGGGNNQATGSYSFIGGGGDAGTAANRNVASGDWSVVGGGQNNKSTGAGSFIGGGGTDGSTASGNTASGILATIGGGRGHTASGQASFIGSGFFNTSNSQYSTIAGGVQGTTRSISGNFVFPACVIPLGNSSGLSQAALLILGKQTTDATATVITSDGGAAGSTNQVILPNNSAYYFKGTVVAGVTGAGDTASWEFAGTIKRGANAGTTALVGVPVLNLVSQDTGASTWTVALTADTTNGGLAVTVTGQAATTIRWVAKIETTEMTF